METRPSATDLLSLLSFFVRQAILKALLRGSLRSTKVVQTNSDEDADRQNEEFGDGSDDSILDRFEEDLLTLREYSFISCSTQSDMFEMFEMHALVQLATRDWPAT